jgi:hypothetical protein
MPAGRLMSDAGSARALELAARFVAGNDAFIAFLESLTLSQWLTLVAGEERTVAALAHHVAWAMLFEVDAFETIAAGREPSPVTLQQLADVNAINGAEYAELRREDAIALLRQNAATAAAFVRSLTDEELARSGHYLDYVPGMTLDNWIRRILINHIEMHTKTIKAVLDLP